MLKLLGKLLNRDLTTPQEPLDTNVSDDEIWEILHPSKKGELAQKKKNVKAFVQSITSHLSKAESQRLCRAATCYLDDVDNTFEALNNVISGDHGQKRGKWIFIQLDWKATEEISWQVSEVLTARGIDEQWVDDCSEKFDSVPLALLDLSEWLSSKWLDLLHLETHSDSYCCFVTSSDATSSVKELAKRANLTIYDQDEFRQKNT